LFNAPKSFCNFFDNTPAKRYQLNLPVASRLTINLSSPDFNTYVCLLGVDNREVGSDDNSGSGTNSRLVTGVLPTGLYYIEVTTGSPGGAGGAYTLSVQTGLPPGIPIAPGETATGTLRNDPKSFCFFFDGLPALRYQFDLSSPTTVTITVSSTQFLPHICLLNADNTDIARDADDGRISQALSVGRYYIEVTTRSPGGGGGAFTLGLN